MMGWKVGDCWNRLNLVGEGEAGVLGNTALGVTGECWFLGCWSVRCYRKL